MYRVSAEVYGVLGKFRFTVGSPVGGLQPPLEDSKAVCAPLQKSVPGQGGAVLGLLQMKETTYTPPS